MHYCSKYKIVGNNKNHRLKYCSKRSYAENDVPLVIYIRILLLKTVRGIILGGKTTNYFFAHIKIGHIIIVRINRVYIYTYRLGRVRPRWTSPRSTGCTCTCQNLLAPHPV